MRWIKASERLPELIDRKSTPKHVRYLKKRWKGEPYVAIAVAYYFPDRFKTVAWEDWDDYNQEVGVVWLRAGWYSSIDCDKCEGYWSAPLNVIEWLDESGTPHPSNRGKGMRNNKELFTDKTTVMTKNKPEYLKLYKEWMEKGKISIKGLCGYFGGKHELLRLFEPTDEDFIELYRLRLPGVFWGRESYDYERDDFTPLRQTIVLFMAAMNNEL